MDMKDLLEELEVNPNYKTFMEEHPDAYLSAGFLILEEGKDQIQLDFFIPSIKKVASFEHPFIFAKPKIHEDIIENMAPQTVETKVDISDLVTMCKEILLKNENKLKPSKIIAILRDGRWNLTCLDDMLGMVRIKIDALTAETLSFEKGSLMDFMSVKKP